MRTLDDLSTVREVDAFVDEICRNLAHPQAFRAKIEAGDFTAEERAENPKIDAVLKALERRAELQRGVLA